MKSNEWMNEKQWVWNCEWIKSNEWMNEKQWVWNCEWIKSNEWMNTNILIDKMNKRI